MKATRSYICRLWSKKIEVGEFVLFLMSFTLGAMFSLFCVLVIQWLGIARLATLLGVR
jgi:hypothetical protein